MDDTLAADAAAEICRHMNDDHADAVAGYARVFAKVPGVRAARIVALDATGMDLAVDTGGASLTARVPFDHPLADTDDARRTLVAMARQSATQPEPEAHR